MERLFKQRQFVMFAVPPDGDFWPAHKEYFETHRLSDCKGTVMRADEDTCYWAPRLPYYVRFTRVDGSYAGSLWCAEGWLTPYEISESPLQELDDFLDEYVIKE